LNTACVNLAYVEGKWVGVSREHEKSSLILFNQLLDFVSNKIVILWNLFVFF